MDSEVIEEILDATATVFAKSPDNAAARTALSALSVTSLESRRIIGLSSDYAGLDFGSRHKSESALTVLATTPTEAATASTVFEALAAAMAADRPADARADVSDLIAIWLSSPCSGAKLDCILHVPRFVGIPSGSDFRIKKRRVV